MVREQTHEEAEKPDVSLVSGLEDSYDVAIIGAGIIGTILARSLMRYRLKVLLLEKDTDVAMGAT